jgi:hypothetical protein
VVDVSDPTNPVEITDLDLGTGNHAGHLAVLNGRAFVSGYGPFPDRRLFVIDVTDPTQPAVEAAPLINEGGGPITVRDDLAYIMDFTGWMQAVHIYDVSEPRNPMWTGSVLIESQYDEALTAVDGHVLVTTYLRGLTIVETTDPTDPVAVATLDVPGRIQDAAYYNGVLFIATEERGLRMVDVSDPSQPVHLAYSDVVPSPAAITIRGDLAYAIGYWGQGLAVLDISNPADLSLLGSAPGIGGEWLTVAGDHAYLASWSFGIYVVDVSTPTDPVHVASLDLPSGTGEDWEWPVVSGDHLFVRNNHNDPYIAIIDVGDPTMPTLVGTIDVWANVAGLATTGTWLLVPDYDAGPEVRIFDVSNPATPIELDPYVPVSGYAEIVEVSGSVAYLSILAGEHPDYKQFVEAVDLADPLAPVFLGVSPDTWYVLRLRTGSEGVFVVSLETGFDILGHCHSPIFADDFESGTTAAWSGGVP